MKKLIFSLGLCFCMGFMAMAQESTEQATSKDNDPAFTSRRGVPLLPKAGDFAIGIDATPFLNYVGNMFNQSNGISAPSFDGVDLMIYGKYFVEDNVAIRAKLYLNTGSDVIKGVVQNDAEVANNPLNSLATVIDVMKAKSTNVELRVGYEFRRGRGRIQGFYGGEVGVGYGSGKYVYEYANPMTAVNSNPSSFDFNGNVASPERATETKLGNSFSGTIAAFAGVEFFIAPQLSIGGEFNLGLTYASQSQSESTVEYWDGSKVATQSARALGSSWPASSTSFATKPTGTLFLMFHF